MYRIELINKKTNEIKVYDNLTDMNEGETLFIQFEINTLNLDDGEYLIKLYDEDELVATDTLILGEFDVNGIQYKKGENIYIETKINVKLQEKTIDLTDSTSIVTPDEGFDGMLSVTVDATQVFQNGREEGYQNGREDGIEEQRNKLSSITITENDTYINEDGYSEVVVDVLPKLQEKSVNVTDNNTTVTADDEFDGLSQVNIDATPLYNNAYSEGKSDGVEEQKEKLSTITINSNGTYNKEDGYNEVTVDVKVQSYSYLTNTVDEDGLRQLGWSDDDINYYKDNTLHYEWQNKDYIVSQGNKQIVINSVNDIALYKENPDFEYCPFFETNYGIYWYNIFYGCKFLKGIPSLSTVSATTMNNAFDSCSSLETISPLDTSTIQKMSYMFRGCSNLKTIPQLNTSNVTDMSHIFQGCTNLKTIPQLNTSNVIYMSYMFYGCTNLKTIPQLNTSNVTEMTYMFNSCSNLKTIPLLDTSNVTGMNFMFSDCSNLTTIPQLDTSRVYDVTGLFKGCSNLKTIPQLNTSNVTDMSHIFQGCKSLITIPLFDTSNVVSMTGVFQNCDKLQTIPQLNTSKAQDMGSLFSSCTTLQSLPLLDFSSATNISSFFGYSNITTLTDLGGFKNLKIDWKDNYGLAKLPNLTKQSVLNVITHLYNFRENGDSTTTRTLKLHKNSLALLSDDEKAIATAKGWVLSS